jgi:hypothetical protein
MPINPLDVPKVLTLVPIVSLKSHNVTDTLVSVSFPLLCRGFGCCHLLYSPRVVEQLRPAHSTCMSGMKSALKFSRVAGDALRLRAQSLRVYLVL